MQTEKHLCVREHELSVSLMIAIVKSVDTKAAYSLECAKVIKPASISQQILGK